MWKVDWFVVQRMIIDAPNIENDEEKKDNTVINLTEQSAEDLINNLTRNYNG